MSEVVTLEDVRHLPCLVLLGEPGSGKSVSLLQEAQSATATVSSDDEVLCVDLGLAQDPRALRDSVFGDPAVMRWREGRGRLQLFLDALDEAKIQIRRVVSLLEHELGRLDLGRMALRIACRTADRPRELESWLAEAFGDGAYRTLELAPLRMSETMSAATAADLDAEYFVESVLRAGVAPLAARPLTLKMLLRVFLAEGGFPDALASLYEQALLVMAGESIQSVVICGRFRTARR
jgi:hypothetical protein